HYLRALRHDSTLVLAAWRLGNARRWMPLRSGPPYPASLLPQFLAQRDSVPGTDRLLIEAQFEPTGRARLDRYEDALKLARDDPYPALLYGDELFHRGPLAGRPLDDAVRMLERATAADSTLAPGWEHLAWALIRRGERDRAAVALEHLGHWAGGEEETEIPVPLFLGIAWQFRFQGPGQRAAMEGLARDTARLALAARGAMSFDLPDAQAMLAQALVARAGTASLRGSGYVAEGVARYALGQPGAALAAFDSAAHQFSPAGEARLQAAEWRVVPAALGVPGPGAAERERGRRRLEEMLEDPALGVRAAWALALDAYRRGDTLAGARFAAIVTRAPTATARRLAPSLEGVRGAAAGRLEDALESSAPALAWDSAGLAPDPFLRATLHLLRGEWLESLGRADEADRSWLWYENLDVRGWPSAEAQPAEVDWALSTEARARRARLARERGQASRACALASRALQLWARAEPVLDGARHDLERLARECPR
ncbi:MAG TPA: hypothetical protein VEB59_15680, partial [Gemmatimonadales bacterium]|nr:hypothetical protein [Gemmatimonadales bacterium]